MKKLYVVLLLLISQQIFSQHTNTFIGKWKLGLNIGATWQTADVSTDLFDLGYGATLEYAIHEKRSSYFGFSLRGRFLQGKTTGYDYLNNEKPISNNAINGTLDTSLNYSFSPLYLNNQTSLNEFSLEAMLKWNRLYQEKGILFYLFVGGGFTSYKVETDQLNANGDMYDYSVIDGNNGSSTVTEIKNLQDGEYETELNKTDYNKLVFTPSVGIGLGFRIIHGIDLVFEHKVSLPQTDLFDGQVYDSGDPSFIQDIYQYSSLGIIFSIVGHTDSETYTPISEPTEPITVNPATITPIKPHITLTQPTLNTFNTPNCKIEIVAKIENVSTQKDITFYHNSNKVPSYKFFFSPPIFKSTLELTEGNNTFKIIANNGNLSDSKEFSLKCNNINTIAICHKNNNGSLISMNIASTEWANHAAHGDVKGNCVEKQITICHNVPGHNKTQTIKIDESKWAIHKSHGDYLGSCQEKKMIVICHNNQDLTIDEKDWASHASHGDLKEPCPKTKMITICHIPPTGNKRQTLTIKETEWIVHQAHGDYKGTCPAIEPTTVICHKNTNGTKSTMTIPNFRWNEHFAHGDSKGACPQVSFIICHKDPSTGKKSNISIYSSAWAQHAAHGDTKGTCLVIDKQITICHKIPGQNGKTQTIKILESKWLIHKSHGDKLGACPAPPEKMIPICHLKKGKKSNLIIKESDWPFHASHGDTKGTCPVIDNQISICHTGQEKGAIPKTILIPVSSWPAHQAHGDVKGSCSSSPNDPGNPNSTTMTICHHPPGNPTNTQTIQINSKSWASHQAHGDTKGSCPRSTNNPTEPSKIKICHTGQEKGAIPKTILIPVSSWPAHQAHGDVKGSCSSSSNDPDNPNSTKMTICHHPSGNPTNTQTIQIDSKSWASHQAHGDTVGSCPKDKKKIKGKENGKGKTPKIGKTRN